MDNKFTLQLTKAYFSESYEQAIKYGSKIRKFEYFVSLVFLIFGIGLFIYSNGETILPLVFIGIAIFEFFSSYIKRYFWLKKQLDSKVADKNVEITVTEEGITTKGPYSEGVISWDGIERILETPKGLIIWPQKGMQIYLPKSVINKEIVDFSISKCALR